ncbi:CheY-like chemotaxis protein [Burkholderia sp. OAS925]|uniref:hypothetical protein n=1 Tax=Paraburkholderia sp. OAS925 TaxID=2663827 RepID=UPI00178B5F2C
MKIVVSGSHLPAVKVIAEEIRSIGHEAAVAWPAATAAITAADWAADAALLDIATGEDAVRICKALRSDPKLGRCKVIALWEPSAIDFAAISLFDAVLQKPVDVSVLASALGDKSVDGPYDR